MPQTNTSHALQRLGTVCISLAWALPSLLQCFLHVPRRPTSKPVRAEHGLIAGADCGGSKAECADLLMHECMAACSTRAVFKKSDAPSGRFSHAANGAGCACDLHVAAGLGSAVRGLCMMARSICAGGVSLYSGCGGVEGFRIAWAAAASVPRKCR